MREILFRGKRTINGDWVYGDFVHGNERKSLRDSIFVYDSETQSFNDYEINPSTLGQYTGLTDKNGKRIFEGDILFLDDIYDIKGIINYSMGCFCVKLNYLDYLYRNNPAIDIVSNEYQDLEVIGNIHDNKSLLNNQDAGE